MSTGLKRVAIVALLVAIAGAVLSAFGLMIETRRMLRSYLFAYTAILTVVLGCLIQVMISHITGAHWFVVLRRITLDLSAALPVFAVLFVPILWDVRVLYPWATPGALPPAAAVIVQRKTAWLNVPFFDARAVLYLAVWIAFGELLRRYSLRQDRPQDHACVNEIVAATRRLRLLSALGLIAVGLTLTFAAFDWMMSLDPAWYSTIYGVYVFAGGFLAGIALVAVVAYVGTRHNNLIRVTVTPEHFGALANLLLTFVIFWAYIAFSQYLIVWIGDIPADVPWYLSRVHGSWGWLAMVLLVGQFALPVLVLMFRRFKRSPAVLALLGAWLILMHLLDTYWLVLPSALPKESAGMHPGWTDAAALLLVSGCAVATAAWRASAEPVVPLGDPYLLVSESYRQPQ